MNYIHFSIKAAILIIGMTAIHGCATPTNCPPKPPKSDLEVIGDILVPKIEWGC